MKNKKLSDMSDEALRKQEKTIKLVTGMLAGALLVLFIMATILSVQQGFNALIIVPFGLLPIVVLNVNHLNEIKKELNSRKGGL